MNIAQSAGLFIGIASAVLFFRAAEFERLHPLLWSVSSLGLTAIVVLRGGGIWALVLVQLALYMVMWAYNVRRKGLA